MYVKIFAQIFDSSIAEDYLVRLVFEDFLILADKDGHVDMTVAAIARRTNVPVEIVSRAIEKLSSPDPDSRTPDEDGRRIVLLDRHRSWGWRIVNYPHYRSIRDDEARKEYFREQKREQRSASKKVLDTQRQSKTVQQSPEMSPKQKQEAKARTTNTASDEVTAEMVASAVLTECRISGRDLRCVLEDVCRAELGSGRDAAELRDSMITSYRQYSDAKSGLDYSKGAAKFFGDGDWRNPAGWPWKEGKQPVTANTARIPTALEILAAQERDWEERRAN